MCGLGVFLATCTVVADRPALDTALDLECYYHVSAVRARWGKARRTLALAHGYGMGDDYNQEERSSMSIDRLAAMVETWVHLLVGEYFRTSGLEFDSDTAGSGTQPPVAAVVQH